LATGQHLAHVVHFGDQQIFPGSTNYVCLLFLQKAGVDFCRYVVGHDLQEWLKSYCGNEVAIPSGKLTSAEWNFAVGAGANLFERLKAMPVKLGDLADRISQGIRTSANEIYVLDVISKQGGLLTAQSVSLGMTVVIESEAVSSFLAGREIKRFIIQSSGKVALIPYRHADGRTRLFSAHEFRKLLPKAFKYMEANRTALEDREDGRMRGQQWYGFIYPKNIDVMKLPKILVPDIADRASFAFDEHGEFAFTSGYGITLKPTTSLSPKYLLGLLNSHLLDFFWKGVSTPLRGGFYRYFTQFIERLPIRPLVLADPGERAEHDAVVRLVDRVIAAKKKSATMDTSELEREIDALVYRLYGLTPDEIKLVEESLEQ
jgi:hypothetical protein